MDGIDEFGFQWHITGACPGRCLHCYQSGSDDVAAELPANELKRIADCIMSAVRGPVTVNITGGEPLMYQRRGRSRGVFDLMSHLSTFNNLDELNIITSTHVMDSEDIDNLKALPKLTFVKVSLESNDQGINDGIRGLGHFRMAADNIVKLTAAGLQVIIMATLSKRNYESAAGLCALAGDLGTQGVIFERFVPLGCGNKMQNSVLTSSEWQEVLAAIANVAGVSADDLRPYKAFHVGKAEISGAPCCLGPASMALMPDGTVYPCRRVPAPAGKLPDDGMERILGVLSGYSSTPQKCFDFGF